MLCVGCDRSLLEQANVIADAGPRDPLLHKLAAPNLLATLPTSTKNEAFLTQFAGRRAQTMYQRQACERGRSVHDYT